MKKTLTAIILSAALIFSACSVNANEPPYRSAEADQSDTVTASPITESTTPITTTKSSDTTPIDTAPTEKLTKAPTQTEATQEQTEHSKEFPGITKFRISCERTGGNAESKGGKPCRSTMYGLEYEDFPAKEDIEPAIKCAFEGYFRGTEVCHIAENGHDEIKSLCTVENLHFESGLYLDFNGDGEKESVIVVGTDSAWFSYDSVAVYYADESDYAVLNARDYISTDSVQALIYDDCTDIIVESILGPAGQAIAVYSFDNGCKKEFTQGKGDVYPADTYTVSYSWYRALNGDPPIYYIRTDNGYVYVGMEEIEAETLIEKIPETEQLMEMIEDYYEEEIVNIKTVGYLGFFFFMKDEYVCARITDDILYSNFISRSIDGLYYDEYWDGEEVYGLCLL